VGRRIRQLPSAARKSFSKSAASATLTTRRKKIGPGLKGLNKRGTFTVNGNKVTDENLKTWIENGDSSSPFKTHRRSANQRRHCLRKNL